MENGTKATSSSTNDQLLANIEEVIKNRRLAKDKRDIWLRLFPLKTLIRTHYQVLTNFKELPPHQLLKLGKLLLEFIKELKLKTKTSEEAGIEPVNINNAGTGIRTVTFADETTDPEIQEFLKLFDSIFERIISSKIQGKEDFEGFLDIVWIEYIEGNIDFTQTSVIENLLRISYRHLENVLATAINTRNPQHLHSTAIMSSDIFQAYLHLLHKIYQHYNNSPKLLKFTRDFLKDMPFRSNQDCLNFYPTPFQPLLFFTSQIPVNVNSTMDNHILLEILRLANDLYKNHQGAHLFISFILKSNSELSSLLNRAFSAELINFKQFPYLWQIKLTTRVPST